MIRKLFNPIVTWHFWTNTSHLWDIVPSEWTKVKIEIIDDKAKLYVNGADQSCLLINDLKQGKDLRGSIGLWVAIGTIAHFTDLKITKCD